ncbi:MAG TPA: TraM recognition domain-containing protein [Aquella sp.]|nr:TraM recognition domain-containing protein [Aquella sp.]
MENFLNSVYIFFIKYFFVKPHIQEFLFANIYWVYFSIGIWAWFTFQYHESKNLIAIVIKRLGAGGSVIYIGLTTFMLFIPFPNIVTQDGRELQLEYRQEFLNQTLPLLGLSFICGFCIVLSSYLFLKRKYGSRIQELKNRHTKTHHTVSLTTKQLVKELQKYPPKMYNPIDYFKTDKQLVFLNWDAENSKAIYDSYSNFSKKHAEFLGRSQSGKNLGIQPLAIQMMMYGEFVIMFDVKNGGVDIMAPLLYKFANNLHQPYTYMEFGVSAPGQFNILQTKDIDTLQEIILQLCNIQETSDMATDFYQKQAKKIALSLAQFAANSIEEVTIRDLMTTHYTKFFNPETNDTEKSKVETSLQILAEWDCINAKGAPNILKLINTGGVWYVQTKTKEAYPIIQAIVSIILRLHSRQRRICLIADEFFKYLNKDFIEVLTEGGGKGIHCLIAYQTAALLKAPQLNISSQDMIGTLFANCSYSYVYGSNDPFIIEQLEQVGGTIKVMVETEHTERGITLTDKSTGKKSYREQDVPKISKDMLNLIRDREAFLLFAGHATNRTHTGIIPLISGIFSKEAPEFEKLKLQSRKITSVYHVKQPQERSHSTYNPFV